MTAGDAVVVAAPGDVVREGAISVDHVDLFLFSAACWLPHRIHFDQQFAQSEGLSDTPVHGPMQASWLCQLADEWATELGGRLVESRVRHLSSVYPNEKLLARVVVAAVSEDGATVDVELRLERAGEVVTSGTGRIALDGTGDS